MPESRQVARERGRRPPRTSPRQGAKGPGQLERTGSSERNRSPARSARAGQECRSRAHCDSGALCQRMAFQRPLAFGGVAWRGKAPQSHHAAARIAAAFTSSLTAPAKASKFFSNSETRCAPCGHRRPCRPRPRAGSAPRPGCPARAFGIIRPKNGSRTNSTLARRHPARRAAARGCA